MSTCQKARKTRSVATQAMVTYKRKYATPRFHVTWRFWGSPGLVFCVDSQARSASDECCKRHQNLGKHCFRKEKDGSYAEPKKAEAFEKVFGQGRSPPPDMSLATSVILWYEKECSGSQGKKVGQLNLTTFIEKHGTEQRLC